MMSEPTSSITPDSQCHLYILMHLGIKDFYLFFLDQKCFAINGQVATKCLNFPHVSVGEL